LNVSWSKDLITEQAISSIFLNKIQVELLNALIAEEVELPDVPDNAIEELCILQNEKLEFF
jgi:hypothetical protein